MSTKSFVCFAVTVCFFCLMPSAVLSGPLDYEYQTTITYGEPDIQSPSWYDTGLDIAEGVEYVLVPYGRTRIGTASGDRDAFGYGPEGAHSARWGPHVGENGPMNGAPHMALIAKVGESGFPIYLGSSKAFYLYSGYTGTGRLYLIVNDNFDNPSGWYGNEGTLWVDVYLPNLASAPASWDRTNPAPRAVLAQNYPNPFDPSTTIRYSVESAEPVSLTVFDAQGRFVRTLVRENAGPGTHTVRWDGKHENGRAMPSGTYFYQLEVGGETIEKKMIMLNAR